MYSIKNGVTGEYFFGNKISNYGIENGRVDYATLAKAFNCVLNNTIYNAAWDIDEWEQLSGFVDNSEQIDELREQIETLECEITLNSSDESDAAINARIDALNEKIDDLEQEQEYTPEIFQFYIVDDNGAEILQEINESVFYNSALDVYLWGVTHWGTSWDYVLTDIPCNCGYEILDN